jgi:uncharacterized protein
MKEFELVSEFLVGRRAIKSQVVQPGEGYAAELKQGDLLQIITLHGKQVVDFVAVSAESPDEMLSTGVTRSKNSTIMLQKGMPLYSNRRNELFQLVEDTVGRHDMLFAACDPRRYQDDFGIEGHANCRESLAAALTPFGLTYDTIPDPVNWFMNVAILQRGELELRESLAERNDFVLLVAAQDVVAGISPCPQDQVPINGMNPTEIMVRVYR